MLKNAAIVSSLLCAANSFVEFVGSSFLCDLALWIFLVSVASSIIANLIIHGVIALIRRRRHSGIRLVKVPGMVRRIK
jgi:hypothetical protein